MRDQQLKIGVAAVAGAARVRTGPLPELALNRSFAVVHDVTPTPRTQTADGRNRLVFLPRLCSAFYFPRAFVTSSMICTRCVSRNSRCSAQNIAGRASIGAHATPAWPPRGGSEARVARNRK